MRCWSELEGAQSVRDLVVVGNGPSRLGRDGRLIAMSNRGMSIVACNAYWRESALPPPDFLVCYDAAQTEAALRGRQSLNIVVPQQGLDPTCTVFASPTDHERLHEATPHMGAGQWEKWITNDWWPTTIALGNLSGLLAYQLAMILRPRSIYLFGVDCCGLTLAGSGQVLLSAIDEQTPGYGPAKAPASAMRGDAKTPIPPGWDQYRSLWRALTRRAEQAGIPTYRVLDAGALDWIEVKEPCPD